VRAVLVGKLTHAADEAGCGDGRNPRTNGLARRDAVANARVGHRGGDHHVSRGERAREVDPAAAGSPRRGSDVVQYRGADLHGQRVDLGRGCAVREQNQPGQCFRRTSEEGEWRSPLVQTPEAEPGALALPTTALEAKSLH
jgi:hypothetical protein